MPGNDLKSKRSAFCRYYTLLGNAEEAALKAGFDRKNALAESVKCLSSDNCRKNIASLRKSLSDSGNVTAALRRLAFGSCSDAVHLVFAEELPPPDILDRLDLFNVSEMKRDKGGGIEIKFFDRLKAIEKLFELENAFSDRDKAADLLKALSSSAEEGGEIDDI